jgi:hypothetical protein
VRYGKRTSSLIDQDKEQSNIRGLRKIKKGLGALGILMWKQV